MEKIVQRGKEFCGKMGGLQALSVLKRACSATTAMQLDRTNYC